MDIYIYYLDGRNPSQHFVANSFEEFINGLESPDIYDED